MDNNCAFLYYFTLAMFIDLQIYRPLEVGQGPQCVPPWVDKVKRI